MADFAQIKIDTMNDIANAIIENGGSDGPMYPRDMAGGIRALAAASGGGGCDCGYTLYVYGWQLLQGCKLIINDSDVYDLYSHVWGDAAAKFNNSFNIYDGYWNNAGATICYLTIPNVKSIRVQMSNAMYGLCQLTFNDTVIYDGNISNPVYTVDWSTELTSVSQLKVCNSVCLHPTTEITLPDFSTKQLKDIRVGDKVLSLNPMTNEFEEDVVFATDAFMNKFGDDKDVWTFSDGSTITTIHPHEFYSVDDQKFKYIANFNIGERLLKLVDGKLVEVKLEKHENIVEKTPHATLFTQKNNIYFANGILTGNRNSAKLNIRG